MSRQAISKWENGAAVPELDKLQAMAAFFGVTLDALTRSGGLPQEEHKAPSLIPARLGVALCLVGAVGLLLFSPEAAGQLNTSSAVTLNGSGLAMLLCVAVMVLGLGLVLRKK